MTGAGFSIPRRDRLFDPGEIVACSRKLGLAVLFLALGSVSALAADFNGKWSADVTTPRGTQTLTFDFHVDGATLTGKVTSPRGDMDITEWQGGWRQHLL